MKHNFRPFMNPVFIETGSYCGDGVEAALHDGFDKVISIELSEQYYTLCVGRFKNNRSVSLFKGNSPEILRQVLPSIRERITFWLDAHYSGDDTAKGDNPVPMLEELEAIHTHATFNDNIILIDDMRLFRNVESEWWNLPYTLLDVENAIRKINPKYKITYIKGITSQDILVAQI